MSRQGLRSLAAPPTRAALRGLVRARTLPWPRYSRLFVVSDGSGWSVDEDAVHLADAARRLGYDVGSSSWARFAGGQAVFHTSHFEAIAPRWLTSSHRLGVAWLHGRPGTPGAPEFDHAFAVLRRHPDRFARIHVTHAEMQQLVVDAGVDPSCVHRIPIGIDIEHFPFGDAGLRGQARAALRLPGSAFVVGSFQKDGVGWGEGLEAKLVKGPDVLVEALARLNERVSELVVLLTGPSRGYVRSELDRRSIPYVHVFARSRAELARAYHAIDVYLVSSRQEGGPKAVLEAMAAGAPLVSTRVGQATELVEHGRNGWLVDVEDAEGLADSAHRVFGGAGETVRDAGRATAEAHALEVLDARWASLLEGFVEGES